VLQIGTFEDVVKYMIAFALLCSFQGEKLFPKTCGVSLEVKMVVKAIVWGIINLLRLF